MSFPPHPGVRSTDPPVPTYFHAQRPPYDRPRAQGTAHGAPSGQSSGPYPKPPNHVVSIRERRWKLAKYYDVDGNVPPQWEMYDLKRDPQERRNLAYKGHRRTPLEQREYRRLKRRLARVQKTRLQP